MNWEVDAWEGAAVVASAGEKMTACGSVWPAAPADSVPSLMPSHPEPLQDTSGKEVMQLLRSQACSSLSAH